MNDKKDLNEFLRSVGACQEAVEWAAKYKTLPSAWKVCPRGDWMLWLAAKANLCSRQELVLAACACARLALKHVPAGEKRPLAAIEAAELWARGGDITLQQIRIAAYAAADAAETADAADAAYAAYAAYAADAAADAADAAYAAYAAYVAAAAAYAAAAAAHAAAYAARSTTLKKCATIIRKHAKVGKWAIK